MINARGPVKCTDEHDPPLVGGCIVCTYNEMRRYKVLYESAMRVIVREQENRMERDDIERRMDSLVRSYGKELIEWPRP